MSKAQSFWAVGGAMLLAVLIGVRLFTSGAGPTDSPAESPAESPAASNEEAASPTYQPTPENDAQLQRYVSGVLTVVLLHEMGHMVISEYDIPVFGREEDAADRFAVAVLTPTSRDDDGPLNASGITKANALMVALQFWHDLHTRTGMDKAIPIAAWADEHGLPEQRAYDMACLLYGSDTSRFAALARGVQLPPEVRPRCVRDAGTNDASWRKVIKPHLTDAAYPANDPANAVRAGAEVGVFYHGISPAIALPAREILRHAMNALAADSTMETVAGYLRAMTPPLMKTRLRTPRWNPDDGLPRAENTYEYRINADACLNEDNEPMVNAFWRPQSRTITLCYGLVANVRAIGMEFIASAKTRMVF